MDHKAKCLASEWLLDMAAATHNLAVEAMVHLAMDLQAASVHLKATDTAATERLLFRARNTTMTESLL